MPDSPSSSDIIRLHSRRILDLANSGTPRHAFFRGALGVLAQAAGHGTVRMLLREQERRFFGECSFDRPAEAAIEISREEVILKSAIRWTAGDNDGLEAICRKLMMSKVDSQMPWFTDFGSLAVSDADSFPGTSLRSSKITDPGGLYLSASGRSTVIVPVDGSRRRLGLVQFESPVVGFFSPVLIDRCERLTQVFGLAVDHRNLQVALRERVKELTCLYDIVRLIARVDSPLDEVLQQVVDLMPPGWLYPEAATARIVLDDRSYETEGADRMVRSLKADILVDQVKHGFVEIGYTEERPTVDEGPFLLEERHLLDTIARELAFTIEQRTHAEEKRNLQVQLRHADRLATLGQLAAGVAHELNEPLASIVGFAQLAAKQPGVPADAARDMNKIVSAAMHARGIIRELLVFAREARPVKITFSLNKLIRDGLFFLESRFVKAGITLSCDLDSDLPDITADRSQLLQVLTNLVVNSVQAMPDGGRLTIRTSRRDGFVHLSIEDTGCGMDEKTLKGIFHPFFTTKDIDQGTGLGLSVVHGIVASHDGRIDVASRPGEGSQFSIRLPIVSDPDPQENQPHAR